jgi:hypothetical protein
VVGSEDAQGCDLIGMVPEPGGAGLLETGMEDMAVTALDHARANRQTQGERARIVQAVQPIAQITVAVAHRRFLLIRAFGFQMGLQRGDDFLHRSPPPPLLLRPPPAISPAGLTTGRRRSQVFADMKEVAAKDALLPEDLLALRADPPGTISHRMNLAVQSPARHPEAVSAFVQLNENGLSFLNADLHSLALMGMNDLLSATCPTCGEVFEYSAEDGGRETECPHCHAPLLLPGGQLAEPATEPIKVPFFKFSRRNALKKKLDELIADGEYSDEDADHMGLMVSVFKLDPHELTALRVKAFKEQIAPIFERIFSTFHLTKTDEQDIKSLGKNLQVAVEYDESLQMCKDIYAMEVLGQNPLVKRRCTDVLLKPREAVYFSTPATWAQIKTNNRGFGGMSISVPTGIKGVRIRAGRYLPVSSTSLSEVARGQLYVSNKRLIFDGDQKNTSITFGRLLNLEVFSDALCVEKTTGKPDYFFMHSIEGKYISTMVRFLHGSV